MSYYAAHLPAITQANGAEGNIGWARNRAPGAAAPNYP